MKIKKISWLILLNSIVLAILCACSDNAKNKKINDVQRDILRVDLGSEVPSLDPTISEDTSSLRLMYDLFAGLVDFDQKNVPIPGMASSWDISTNGKTYTFHLRPDLKFSDGSVITTKDFIYSWQRLVDPKTASPYNFLLSNIVNADAIMKGKVDKTALGISAVDSYTLEVRLVHPDTAFISYLTMPNLMVISQKAIEKYGAQWTKPENIVTSGAYVLKEHIVNGYILAERNPYYYLANDVKIPKVRYLPYVDTNIALSNYKADNLDINGQTVPVDQYKKLKREYPKQLHTVKWESIDYYDFNMTLPKFANNLKLRKALSMAVDRDVLTKEVLQAGQTALYSVVTPTIENAKYANINYDWAKWSRKKQIEEARKLYKEAGYGINNPLELTISYNTNDRAKKMALAVASMWKDVLGVDTKIQNQEWKTFLQARHKADFDIARDGWVADYNSVTSYTPLYQCGNGQNNSHYCNMQYNQLLDQAIGVQDIKKQQQLYRKALTVALNDYATIPLCQATYQRLVKPYVKGYHVDGNYLDHVQSKWFSLSK